jgi:tetratricopeptide (TPR) repeat protein
VAALALAVVLIGVLSYVYRVERSARGRKFFDQGRQLLEKQRYEEAIEQFRNALSISHGTAERLALAEALEQAGRGGEATIYFREVLAENPASGPAHLGLARVAAADKDIEEMTREYLRAAAGSWSGGAQRHAIAARLELIGALEKLGRPNEARAEQAQLRQAWRQVLQRRPDDAEAYAGLGESDLALNDPVDARAAFRQAVRLQPGNDAWRTRLQFTNQVLGLDPEAGGLNAGERYRRSRRLMEAALGSLDECVAGKSAPPPDTVRDAADTARKALLEHGAPRSYRDATQTDIALARQLWAERVKLCGAAGAAEEPLRRALELTAPGSGSTLPSGR